MAYNCEKHRFECDRCGAKIPRFKTVQLCEPCEKWLDKEMAKKREIKKMAESEG